jgi:hypothetical protein
MSDHTTNYVNTLIQVAEDCPVDRGTPPPVREGNPSIAARQYEMIASAPYAHTSDDVIFAVHADRAGIPAEERSSAREAYFSVGRPCLRASDLGKKYGWGIQSDEHGRVALVAVDSPDYARLVSEGTAHGTPALTRAMRSSRAAR